MIVLIKNKIIMRFFYNNIVVLLLFKIIVCNIFNDNEFSVE